MKPNLSILTLACCLALNTALPAQTLPWSDAFKKQWYAGQAELSRYELEQSRYGEIRTGDAVFIFVTEDFLTDKQVKHEFGDGTDTSVLKLNFTRTFITGTYPYSLMTSVFTPVDPKQNRTLKITTSVQEWCGHTFTQLNHRNDRYEGILRSYFQREGDQNFDLPDAILEDELWTRIRLAAERLPLGEITLIPGTQYQRLAHRAPAAESAVAERVNQNTLQVYRVTYQNIQRRLDITYETAFPHAIVAWEETDTRGQRASQSVTTRARRTHTIMLDYWSKNAAADTTYRAQLGLK